MLVPSFDNFSDVRLSILFVTGTYTPAAQFYRPGGSGNWVEIVAVPQYRYALFTFLPVFISFLFTIRHWYHTENSKRKKLRSLPFLILQIWPQYRVGRILYYFRKGNRKWIREKNYFETELSTLGMFVYLHFLMINLSNFFWKLLWCQSFWVLGSFGYVSGGCWFASHCDWSSGLVCQRRNQMVRLLECKL